MVAPLDDTPVRSSNRPARDAQAIGFRFRGCALVGGLLTMSACDAPAVSWVDDAAIITTDPSPLTHPPVVVIDSTLRDSAPMAETLLVQDLLREATAATLLAPRVLSMAAATSPSSAQPPSVASMPSTATMTTAPPVTTATNSSTALPSAAGASAGSLGTDDAPSDSLRCGRSLRVALARGRGRVAVWWSRRTRGRVALLAAWRDTMPAIARLGAWRGPIVVDSLDQGPGDAQAESRGATACSRAAPSVVVDDTYGYVHVGYAITGPEGPGVFYAHQMDPRAAFEVPQAIVYGERLGAVRVAASGDVVAVAYDDPNGGERPRIGLAVSRTAGHVFEDRLIASSAIANARDPYVALRGRAIVVGWSEFPVGGGAPTFLVRRATVR